MTVEIGTRVRYRANHTVPGYGDLENGAEGVVVHQSPLANTYTAKDEFTVHFNHDTSEGWFLRESDEGVTWERMEEAI